MQAQLHGSEETIQILISPRLDHKRHLHIENPRSKFIPKYVYYLLEQYDCATVSFNRSSKEYKKEQLKGKEDWKDVKKESL